MTTFKIPETLKSLILYTHTHTHIHVVSAKPKNKINNKNLYFFGYPTEKGMRYCNECDRFIPSPSSSGPARESTGRDFNTFRTAQSEQCGRSMVEMLGTLAIIGVLSVVGLVIWDKVMDKHRANTLLYEAQKRATVIAGQIGLFGNAPSLAEFTQNQTIGGTFDTDVVTDELSGQFGIKVSGVEKGVCKELLKNINDKTFFRRLGLVGSPGTSVSSCGKNGSYLMIYNNDLEGGESDSTYCDNGSCQTVCGICVIKDEQQMCINECPTEEKACDTEHPDNPCGDECQVCNADTNMCENVCTRKSWIQNVNANQWFFVPIVMNASVRYRAEVEVVGYFNNNDSATLFGSCVSNRRAHVSIWKQKDFYITGRYLNYYPKNNLNYGSLELAKKYTFLFDGDNASINGIYASGFSDYQDNYSNIYATVFAQSSSNTSKCSTTPAKFKLYSLWMKDDENEIDLVPVLSPTESKCGGKPAMYDKVSKKLFCNQGSGNFITN